MSSNKLWFLSVGLLCLGLGCLAQAQVPMTGAGKGKPTSGSGCAQYTTLAAALDGAQNVSAVQTAICGLVIDGTFALLDALYVPAINSTANAKVNWINPGTHNLVLHGTIPFAANQGYTGDGSTGFADTGVVGNATVNYTLNSASIGVCNFVVGSFGSAIAVSGAAGYSDIQINESGGTINNWDINNGAANGTTVYSSSVGSFIASRISSTTIIPYYNNSALLTITQLVNGAPNFSFYLGAQNNNGTAGQFGNHQIGYAFIGGALTSGQEASIYNRLHTYLTAISAPSGC